MYYTYIITNKRKNVLYVGVTGNLFGRIQQHRERSVFGFTRRYHICRLVYYEGCEYVHDAIAREKQLKGWRRSKKELLICEMNPTWEDLSADWF